MRAQDLTIEVRDVTLDRIGQVLPKDLTLNAKVRWCGVGEWTLTLPGSHPMAGPLREPGSGLLVTWTNPEDFSHEVLFSGPTVHPERKRGIENPDGTLTFKGVTDEILLDDSLAYPDPATLDVGAQTQANDVQTGSTEALMRHFVDANIGPGALAGRRRGMLQYIELEGANADRGVPTTQRSPRFANLLETLQSLAVEAPLGFRMVQVDEAIQFQIREVVDRRGTIRLDVDAGTLVAEETAQQGPTVTKPIVAGQGEGTDRTIIERTNPQAVEDEVAWGRAIERFYDRRDTPDVLELEAKGDEELALGAGGTSAKVIPADDSTMRYMLDWGVGDWINVVVNDIEEETIITEAVLIFDKDKSVVGVSLGDVTSFDPRDVQARKQSQLDSRIGYLERATARLPLGTTGQPVSNWNDAIDTGFYWSDNTAANRPYGVSFLAGHVIRNKMEGFERVVQEVMVPSSQYTQVKYMRIGSISGGAWVWGAWHRDDGLLTPASLPGSILGGTYNPQTGRIDLTAGDKTLVVDGLTDARYRSWRIDFEFYTGSPNEPDLRLRTGVNDLAGTPYNNQSMYIAGTGTPAGISQVGFGWIDLTFTTYTGFAGWVELHNVKASNIRKSYNARTNAIGTTPMLTEVGGWVTGNEAVDITGFKLSLTNQANSGFEAGGWVQIRGIA